MELKMIFMRKYILISFIFIGCLACSQRKIHRGQTQCELLYQKALVPWMQYQFESNPDTMLLYKSLKYLDSINCSPVSHKVFKLKISILSLLNHYDEGISYAASFDSTYFDLPYESLLYNNYLRAMKASFMKDTIKAVDIYKGIAIDIQAYLDKHAPNDAALMELFEIKQKIESKEKLVDEVNDLKKQGEYDSLLLDMIIKGIETQKSDFSKKVTIESNE
jgi:hypothetical protein